jgi:hypothetical protein
VPPAEMMKKRPRELTSVGQRVHAHALDTCLAPPAEALGRHELGLPCVRNSRVCFDEERVPQRAMLQLTRHDMI